MQDENNVGGVSVKDRCKERKASLLLVAWKALVSLPLSPFVTANGQWGDGAGVWKIKRQIGMRRYL